MVAEPIISASELQDKFAEYKIIDATWFLPSEARNAAAEYAIEHIAGATFFDIDEVSDKSTDLPHMLPEPDFFAQKISEMGISNSDKIVVYDTHGIFSAPRLWWMFKVFGHDAVWVLDGGIPAWKNAGGKIESGASKSKSTGKFNASLQPRLLAAKADVEKRIDVSGEIILDARSPARFKGEEPEPRKGLRSGSIEGSKNLHYKTLLNHDGILIACDEISKLLEDLGVDKDKKITTTCGSGITACIIALALEKAGFKNWCVYDGSWAEWGRAK